MNESRRPLAGAAVLRPELTEAVLDAVLDQLAQGGVGRLSMQQVAQHAGVGKSALYRRWPGKLDMVMEAISRLTVPDGEPEDTGDLEDDIHGMLVLLHRESADPRPAMIIPDLLAETRRSPELAEAFTTRVAAPRRAWARIAFDRAVGRGEIRDEPAEIELALDTLGGVPFWWTTVHRGTATEDESLRRLSAFVVRALR
ncbi:TetR/AcrR family transcriptional regulator [Amycolatopsis oliviviridis]|uniref:TetR family transcriptional regulator n=1 Tax=Amycolatopsis oliviviridis TaxID=1471590 RepID=A0ABQ3L9V7_9PSEU|nr:TetR/AcrR family transcriptional regulator [Amycolatopsis oliviviridis]GHH06158.1 TetR family transcriptional regulator [Amycolatopsis oliviviridis]